MPMLEGKVAIVVGASAGIGHAIATLFAAEGAAVVLNARDDEALSKVQAEITAVGGQAVAVAGDAALETTHDRLVEAATRRFGGLDIAINNAGFVSSPAPVAEIALPDWARSIEVNLGASFIGARSQIPAMLERGGGSIVFTSTFVGTSVGIPGMGAYATAKAGLMGLVKSITADYGAQGIRANALLPGGTDTAMAGDAAQKQWAAGLHAMKRIAQPSEIAQAALFLASDMASFVSGSALFADGGNAAVKQAGLAHGAADCHVIGMIELVRTNDPVIISFVESLMRDAGIGCLVADQNMSVMDGSLGILPRRILVESDRADEARRILTDAGIGQEMRPK